MQLAWPDEYDVDMQRPQDTEDTRPLALLGPAGSGKSFLMKVVKKGCQGGDFRWGLLHRLDRETSGTLMVAKDEASFHKIFPLMHGSRGKDLHKEYVTLVHLEEPGSRV